MTRRDRRNRPSSDQLEQQRRPLVDSDGATDALQPNAPGTKGWIPYTYVATKPTAGDDSPEGCLQPLERIRAMSAGSWPESLEFEGPSLTP